MIKLFVNGRLASDPQLNETRCSFTLAADSNHYNKETKQTKTEFFRVTLWGKRAETAATWLHKGDPVVITGDFYSDEFIGRDNEKHYMQYLENADFTFLPKPKASSGAEDDELLPDD